METLYWTILISCALFAPILAIMTLTSSKKKTSKVKSSIIKKASQNLVEKHLENCEKKAQELHDKNVKKFEELQAKNQATRIKSLKNEIKISDIKDPKKSKEQRLEEEKMFKMLEKNGFKM